MFDKSFEVFVADHPIAREIHYGIRYQVYCEETGFEDPSRFSNQMEMDQYDDNSVHFIVRSKRTGEWVAGMRLIQEELSLLPTVIANPDLDLSQFGDNPQAAEVSRLCVLGKYRRSSIPSNPGSVKLTPVLIDERRREPEIMLGLLRAAFWYSINFDIKHWVFMAAPSLSRMLNIIALNTRCIGNVIDFHGKRAPHACDMSTFINRLPTKSENLFKMFMHNTAYLSYSESFRKLAYA